MQTKYKEKVEKLLKENNIKAIFSLKELSVKINNKDVKTGEYGIIDETTNRFVRSCKPNYYVLQNDVFVESILNSIPSKHTIISLDTFKENDGILAYIDSLIEIPKALAKYITSIDVVIVDGITQASSLSSGLKVNLASGGFVFFFPESCKSNKRNIKSLEVRNAVTHTIFNNALIEINKLIKDLTKLGKTKSTDSEVDLFIDINYGVNSNNSSKMECMILDLKSIINFNRVKDKSALSSIIGFLEFIVNNSNNSKDGDTIQYLFLSKGRLDSDRVFEFIQETQK